MLGAKNMQNLV